MSSSIANLSAQQLRRAANIKDKIQSLENELGRILGASTKSSNAVAPKKKRKMSAAGRAKIAAAARARWAKVKGQKPAAKPVKKARRKMSAASESKNCGCSQGALEESQSRREEYAIVRDGGIENVKSWRKGEVRKSLTRCGFINTRPATEFGVRDLAVADRAFGR